MGDIGTALTDNEDSELNLEMKQNFEMFPAK
jgi:hypothetical protein